MSSTGENPSPHLVACALEAGAEVCDCAAQLEAAAGERRTTAEAMLLHSSVVRRRARAIASDAYALRRQAAQLDARAERIRLGQP